MRISDSQLLELNTSEAFDRLQRAHHNPLALPDPWKTIVLIVMAQDRLEQGGLVKFFEEDWPHYTSYDQFADAYDRIGLPLEADAIRDAVDAMRIAKPESNLEARRLYIEDNMEPLFETVHGWDDSCFEENISVRTHLLRWVRNQIRGR